MPITITCKDAHRLTSEGMDRELTLSERACVKMHLLACPGCRNFDGQMRLLRAAMHRLGADAHEEDGK